MSIEPGTLYVVATPIGNLGDMSPRAVAVLSQVAIIAAEDTRHSAPLLRHFGITTPLTAYHEHNETRAAPLLLSRMERGEDVALISDAGTPLVSDPGFHLVREAHARALRVIPIPGPTAAIAALAASGLPTDRFVFEGFLPARAAARRRVLEALRSESRTLVFYEAPHRVAATLAEMCAVWGGERTAFFGRELTKTFETLRRDNLERLAHWVAADPDQQRGEVVLVVAGAAKRTEDVAAWDDARRLMDVLLEELPVSTAAQLAARITGLKKNDLYRDAVERIRGKGP